MLKIDSASGGGRDLAENCRVGRTRNRQNGTRLAKSYNSQASTSRGLKSSPSGQARKKTPPKADRTSGAPKKNQAGRKYSAEGPDNEQANAPESPQRPSESESSPRSSLTVGDCNGVLDPSVQNTLHDDEVDLPGTGNAEKPSLGWDNLNDDLRGNVLSRLCLRDFYKAGVLNRDVNALIKSDWVRQLRVTSHPSEDALSPMLLAIGEKGLWEWLGYDSQVWRRLPTINCIPPPDPEHFKDHLVAGGVGLLCVNVEKPPKRAKFIVFNPFTQEKKVLPPMLYERYPVLMHLHGLDDGTGYEVIVAGSSSIGTESLSRKTEVYSSKTGAWVEKGNLPGPEFGLNEYQNGAYFKDDSRCLELLLCVAVLEGGGKGVIVYDMKLGHWRSDHVIQIPIMTGDTGISIIATCHILVCGGSVYVFSEQEYGKEVSFCIHKLHIDPPEGEGIWEEMMNLKRKGSRGLLVYPEFTCVPVSDHEICIFNTVEHTMEVYDIDQGFKEPKKIPAPKNLPGKRFHSLNPLGFVFRPDCNAKV